MAEIKTTRAILGTKTRREVANFPLRIVTLQPRTNMEKTLQPRRKSLSQKTPNEKEKLIRNQNEYSPPHARSNATNVKTNPMTELEIIKERGLGRNTRRSTPTQRKKYSRHKTCKETTHSNLIHQKNQMKQIVYQGNIQDTPRNHI